MDDYVDERLQNVIYFENVFNSNDEVWANCQNKWMMNIDCFSVEFVD